MRKFLEEHDLETLLVIITMVEITKWWIPEQLGSQHLYAVSHWVLSYDHGLIRRGLVGAIMELWLPTVTINNVEQGALIVYCAFLLLLLPVFYALVRYKDKGRRLFGLILFFVVNPVTISLLAHDLGLFDIFLTICSLLSMTLLAFRKHIWLVPILMLTAMFIHEGFLILYAPTLLAAMLFIYLRNREDKLVLVTLAVSTVSVAVVFLVLYKYGTPAMSFDEFSRFIQSRATFRITPLSLRECFFGVTDHYHLASSSLYDAGSIANLILALLILSPTFLILLNLWSHALRNCGAQYHGCAILFLATLGGLLLVPIATDYGRWLSAIIFCNFFSIFFLVGSGVIKVEELVEYGGGSFKPLFVLIILTYVLFGPFQDWNPYPYKDNLIVSSCSIISVLLFDVGFYARWRSLRKVL